MTIPGAAPVLLGLLVTELLGFLAWGFWRSRHDETSARLLGLRDDLFWASLFLALAAIIAFLLYLLLS